MAVPDDVKQPQDHKPSTSLDFVHVAPNGGRIVLPSFSKAFTIRFMRANRDKSDMDMTFELLEGLCDESELEALDSMDLDDFARFQQAWQKHSQVSMGESTAS